MGEHGPARWGGGKRSVRATSSSPAPVEEPAPTEPNATDAAKALAATYDIDLSTLTGTGAGGQIVKDDVEAYVPSTYETPVETS